MERTTHLTLGRRFDDPGRQTCGRVAVIDWTRPAAQISQLVRGGQLRPSDARDAVGARATINGIVCDVTALRFGGIRSAYAAGTVIRSDDQVWVQAGVGHVILVRVRDETGAECDAAEFFCRQHIAAGHCFDIPSLPAAQAA
jgi:methionyl-tRNA formyltransferase